MHGGGGKTLLLAALRGVATNQPCTLIADARLRPGPLPAHVDVASFPPSLTGRFAAERRLRSIARPGDVVLCMGNLPPLLPCQARVSLFLQSRYLCENLSLAAFPPMVRWRIRIERWWLRRRLANDMPVLVQTPTMQAAVRRSLGRDAVLTPFADLPLPESRADAAEGRVRFLYPASGEPHKNHAVLLAAWRLLVQAGVDAELHLTVDHDSTLAGDIERARTGGLPVVNHGRVDAPSMLRLYQTSTALIFPSHLESFGLPLLEARAFRLPIVAAERDYVRDVVEPAETFDPESPVSIARAVRRLLGLAEQPVAPMTPDQFIARLLSARA